MATVLPAATDARTRGNERFSLDVKPFRLLTLFTLQRSEILPVIRKEPPEAP